MKYTADEAAAAVIHRIGYACVMAEEGHLCGAAHAIGRDADDLLKIAAAIQSEKDIAALYEEIVERDPSPSDVDKRLTKDVG